MLIDCGDSLLARPHVREMRLTTAVEAHPADGRPKVPEHGEAWALGDGQLVVAAKPEISRVLESGYSLLELLDEETCPPGEFGSPRG